MIFFWVFCISICIIGLLFTEKITPVLDEWGLLRFKFGRGDMEKEVLVRVYCSILIFICLIFISGNTQLIIGVVGIILGGLIMYYSEAVYFMIGSPSNSWFKADTQIKLFGLFVVIFSAGWMSGVTQSIVYALFQIFNFAPSPELQDFY